MKPRTGDHLRIVEEEPDSHAERVSLAPGYAFLGTPTWRLTTRTAAVRAWSPGRGLFVTSVEGSLDEQAAIEIVRAGNDVIRNHRTLLAFHDWDRVPGYDTEARVSLTRWGVEVRSTVERVHLLTRSKIVQLGITVARIVLDDMLVLHQDQASFRGALRIALIHRHIGEER